MNSWMARLLDNAQTLTFEFSFGLESLKKAEKDDRYMVELEWFLSTGSGGCAGTVNDCLVPRLIWR